ncbi:hypothetical protein EYF80_000307 [Liparis tanakae]|uniref:Uncharacterized protein n=1 Tax=Liparis tanakae TaxID=230148 RepID=A0A4Z2JIW8_9TELE|nr:hypothetical protein EYF80_000307 [Liparis tanakae]
MGRIRGAVADRRAHNAVARTPAPCRSVESPASSPTPSDSSPSARRISRRGVNSVQPSSSGVKWRCECDPDADLGYEV